MNWELFLPVFLTFFIVIDPLGVAMIFIGLGAPLGKKDRQKVAILAPCIALLVLSVFIYLGPGLITALGILPGSFSVAGGILLFMISVDLLFAKSKGTKTTDETELAEQERRAREKAAHDGLTPEPQGSQQLRGKDAKPSAAAEIAVFPLALPLLCGPGAITAVLLYLGQNGGPSVHPLLLQLVALLVFAIAALSLWSADVLARVLGRTGVLVIERVMGILLAGLSVQFVYSGLISLEIIRI